MEVLSHSHTLACEILSHAPKSATTPSKQRVLEGSWLTKKGYFRPCSDEKQLFRERISQASEFIAGSSYSSFRL